MHFKYHVIQFKYTRVSWRAVWRFTSQPWKFKISLWKHANAFFVSSNISSRLWRLSGCIFSTTGRKHRSQRHRSCSPWRLHQYRIHSFWHLYFRTLVIIHQITFAAAAETWNGVFKVRGKAPLTLWVLNLLYSELPRRRQVWMYSVDFWQVSVWKGLCFALKTLLGSVTLCAFTVTRGTEASGDTEGEPRWTWMVTASPLCDGCRDAVTDVQIFAWKHNSHQSSLEKNNNINISEHPVIWSPSDCTLCRGLLNTDWFWRVIGESTCDECSLKWPHYKQFKVCSTHSILLTYFWCPIHLLLSLYQLRIRQLYLDKCISGPLKQQNKHWRNKHMQTTNMLNASVCGNFMFLKE